MKKICLLLSLFALSFSPVTSFAQLTVVPTHPASVLAAKLAGPGITISSPVLTCAGVGNGTFISVLTPIVIDSGIILSTGRAVNTSGLESFLASNNNGAPGDPDLTLLAGTTTNDACTLEFDFVPKGDTVSFNYQFGSEEYINSTCGQYNDAFAFFISGPGISGTQNMALVPGTNIPVTVNSINSGVPGPPGWPGFCNIANCTSMGPGSPFTTYFINNAGGTQVTYRGYTTKLRAYHSVTPCSTYHLKMSVADAANSLYDSGVFIEAGSLSTNTYSFKKTDSIGHTIAGIPHAIVRGCDPATITVLNGRVATSPQKVYFTYAGTAVHGVDISGPDSATIAAGDTSVVISIPGLTSSTPTGPKSIIVYLSSPFSCGIVDTITLTLLDGPFANITTPDTSICLGQAIQIHVAASAGLVYNWAPPATLSSATAMEPFAAPTALTVYTMTATLPLSGCAPIVRTVQIGVNVANMNIITPDTTICIGDEVTIRVSGVPGLSYTWSPAGSLNSAVAKEPTARPTTTTTYSVAAVSTIGGCPASDQVTITVIDPVVTISNPAPSICYGKSVKFLVTGDPTYSYEWVPALDLDNALIQQPTATLTVPRSYTVTATVPVYQCKTQAVASVTILPQVIATASSLKPVCIEEPAELLSYPSGTQYDYHWNGPDGFESMLQFPFIKRARIQDQGIYTVTVTNTITGCQGTDTAYVRVGGASLVLYNVTEDQTIDLGQSVQLGADGAVLYTWAPNDGSLSDPNINNPIATPTVSTTYVVMAVDSIGCKNIDTVHIEVRTADGVFIPSGFSPNGDGLNDIFRIRANEHARLVEMVVFDRWGQAVYRAQNGSSAGWDGTSNGQPAGIGTYNYMIIVARPDGTDQTYKGNVTLIR
ncbi:choice-of-anchor L domain-containing protein [Nemorincola caseinilytica]